MSAYGLSLLIFFSAVRVWISKLGCRYETPTQSYYGDGHERPAIIEYRKGCVRERRRSQERQKC